MSEYKMFQPVKIKFCARNSTNRRNNQFFFLTPEGELRRDDLCLGFENNQKLIKTFDCSGQEETRVCKSVILKK